MKKALEIYNVAKVFFKWVLLHKFFPYDERAYKFLLANREFTTLERWVVKLVGKVNGYE